jgi:hypothetical protein
MTYFQNPFNSDFYGNWVIDDRAHHPTFVCPRNAGRGDDMVAAWAEPTGGPDSPRTYNLSGTDADTNNHDTLNIRFAMNQNDFLDWIDLAIDLTDNTNAGLTPAPVASAMRVSQIVAILNAHPTFQAYFTASQGVFGNSNDPRDRLIINSKFGATRMKFYILNGQAEEVLQFNARAGVAELPTYFARHTVFNRDATTGLVAFEDGVNQLVELDPQDAGGASNVDDDIISNAVDAQGKSLGLDPATVKADWELLEGQSPTFLFTNVVSATETIVYPAGAKEGDLAKRILVSGSDTFITPHTLASGDLITPP